MCIRDRSKGAYHQTEASLADLKRQVRESENSISVLLAKAPQNIDRGTLEEQVMPADLAVGVPLQLSLIPITMCIRDRKHTEIKVSNLSDGKNYIVTSGLTVSYTHLDVYKRQDEYQIDIQDEVKIISPSARGIFYGIQTLRQLMITTAGHCKIGRAHV